MVSRLLAVLVGGALLGALAAPALAAGPADVTVRVEGAATTLVPRTAVRTDTTAINKDGKAGPHLQRDRRRRRAGEGDRRRLERALVRRPRLRVQTIKGESHAFPAPEYFSLWINHRSATEGVCGTTTELQQGDDVLFFVDRCVSGPATFLCTNPPVLPLGLSAPRTVTPGAPFNVSVVEYAADGTPSPVAGATVTGGDAAVTTNAAGNATVTVERGRPVQPARDEGQPRAVGDRDRLRHHRRRRPVRKRRWSRSQRPMRRAAAATGAAASPDSEPPAAAITGIREGQRFARARAPRRLTATIASDPSGLQVVKLRLTRTVGPRCTYYSGKSERFRRAPCGVNRAPWFAVGDREQVDYLLPQKLARGRYVLDVNAVDKAHNRDDVRRRGGNRIVFHVR